MSLIKNDIPILEYDINSEAVIMPGHNTNFKFPERAVMLFMEKEMKVHLISICLLREKLRLTNQP